MSKSNRGCAAPAREPEAAKAEKPAPAKAEKPAPAEAGSDKFAVYGKEHGWSDKYTDKVRRGMVPPPPGL